MLKKKSKILIFVDNVTENNNIWKTKPLSVSSFTKWFKQFYLEIVKSSFSLMMQSHSFEF